MPPSPLLSARIITIRYFSATTHTIDQTMSESRPITLAGVSGMPYSGLNAAFIAYSGLVPMSPNTTPSAPTDEGQGRFVGSVGRWGRGGRGAHRVIRTDKR